MVLNLCRINVNNTIYKQRIKHLKPIINAMDVRGNWHMVYPGYLTGL